MIKRITFFTALSIIPLVLSGCYDMIELNDRAFVNCLYINKHMEGAGRFEVGAVISDLTAYEGADKGADEENKKEKTQAGDTISEGIRLNESGTGLRLFFGQARALLLGKELLSDRTLFMEAMDALERDKELSRKMLVLAAENKEVHGAKPEGEPSLGVFAEKFYKRDNRGKTFKLNLEGLIIKLRKDNNALIPKIKEDEGEIKIEGAAVIKNLTFCGFLNETETRGYLWQHGNVKGAVVNVPINGVSIPFNVESHKNKLSFREGQDGLKMDVLIKVKGTVYTLGQGIQDYEKEVKGLVEREIEKEAEKSNYKLHEILKADSGGIKDTLKKQNYNLWQKYEANWQQVFETMDITVDVQADIKIAGSIR